MTGFVSSGSPTPASGVLEQRPPRQRRAHANRRLTVPPRKQLITSRAPACPALIDHRHRRPVTDDAIQPLSDEQVAETVAAIAERPICLLSLDLAPSV
jgi:hypothetical protein